MSFIPFHCRACDGYWLQRSAEIAAHGTARCACGAICGAISTDQYQAADLALFLTVVESLQRARLSPLKAGRLVIDLDMSEGMSARARLGRMSQLMPALCIIGLIGTAEAATALKALQMFTSVLNVIAAKRSDFDDPTILDSADRKPQNLAL